MKDARRFAVMNIKRLATDIHQHKPALDQRGYSLKPYKWIERSLLPMGFPYARIHESDRAGSWTRL